MKKAVVIGAGQTGRGYVARYLVEKNYEITFIEESNELVDLMNTDKQYMIHFYNKDRTPVLIAHYEIYIIHSEEATKAIKESDYIFVSVGEQNLGNVANQIKPGIDNKQKDTVIITCENGINPASVLRNNLKELGVNSRYVVSQTAVFCSTVAIDKTRLDILSQNQTYFPYDCDELKTGLELNGAIPINNFEKFLKRKIYTYNCLAGIISYFGYIKNYKIYGDAANDPDISEAMNRLLNELNSALAKYFDISIDEQLQFAQKALIKFKDKNILDYVIKNGRDAYRKLGPTERIMAPLKIIKENGGDTKILEFIAAAALCYWDELQGNGREPMLDSSPIEKFCEITSTDPNSDLAKHVEEYLKIIKENRNSINGIEFLFDK